MAANRLDKIGTIYSRVTGLLRAGAIKWDNKPLWYNIYRAFPPINETTYGSPKPEIPIRNIFYTEDKIRAKFHKQIDLNPLKLDENSVPSECQSFIQDFRKLQKESSTSEEEAFKKAIIPFRKSAPKSRRYQPAETEETNTEHLSLTSEFQAAMDESREKTEKTVDSGKLFKDIFEKDK